MDLKLKRKIIAHYKNMGNRSRESIVNIALSFVSKGASILISLMLVPITINYVNSTRYGIWLTLSSIISWIGIFDLGLGNGMRNRFAEAKAKNDIELARQYVSTTYFVISCIVVVLLIIALIANSFIDWTLLLKVDKSYVNELSSVFQILVTFFCINMVVRLFSTLLTADMKPGISSLINVLGQLFSLMAIWILTQFTEGSLFYLAFSYSSIPTLILFICSLYAFYFTRYRDYKPRLSSVKIGLTGKVLNLGFQFFVIYICMIAIFQIMNIVISRELGPASVTEYNIAYKYFNLLLTIVTIIVTPFWSAFTDAYNKKDYAWMVKVKKSLERLWFVSVLISILMFLVSQSFYRLWLGSELKIHIDLSAAMAVYVVLNSLSAIYLNLINGIGYVRIQLIAYVAIAVFSLPVMTYSCRYYGLIGILLIPSLLMLTQTILGKIQIEKILKNKAKGIWAK